MDETQFRSSKLITRLVQASYNYKRFKSNDVTCTACSPRAIPSPHWNNLQLPQQPTDLPPTLGAGGNLICTCISSEARFGFFKKQNGSPQIFPGKVLWIEWRLPVCTADGKSSYESIDPQFVCFPEGKTCILGGAGFQPSKVHQCRDTEPGSLVPRHRPTWLTSQEASWPRLNSTSRKNEQGSFGDRVHGGKGFSTVWQDDVLKVSAWWLIVNYTIMLQSWWYHIYSHTVRIF